ncbi:hypothetical protein BGZ76_007901 [Entomortierella beljakovae]|nr:hypothetical protein BGZ76_007901 [Entomortierella beljakovae]
MSSSSLQMAKPKAPYKATTAVSKDATEKKRTRNNLQIEDKREIIFITDICKIKFEKISRLYGIARNTINGYIKKDQLRGAGQGYNGKSRLKGFALVSESNIRDGKSEARKVVGEILSVNDFQFLNDGDFESYCNEFRIYVEAVGEVIERSKSTMNPIQPPEMFLSFTLTRCILFSGGLDEAICCEVVGTHRAKRAQIISEEFYVSSIIMTNSSGSWRGSELVKVHVPNMSCVQGQDIYYYQAQDAPLTFHELLHRMDTPGPTRTFLIDEQILEALTAKENRRIPTLENIIVLTVPTRLHSAMPASEFAEIVKKDIQKGYATDPGSHIARLCGYWNNLHASITNGYKRFSSEIFLDAYQNHTSILTDE